MGYANHRVALKGASIACFVVTTLCTTYVLSDFIRTPSRRRVPGKLMVSRSVVDWCFGLVCCIMIQSSSWNCEHATKQNYNGNTYCIGPHQKWQKPDQTLLPQMPPRYHPKPHCVYSGAFFTLFLLVSEAYFCGICWDIYMTLKNPFRAPMADSWQVHVFSWIACGILVLGCAQGNAFSWRDDVQICWIKNTGDRINPFTFLLLYIPTLLTVVTGLGTTYWSLKRLGARILDTTWELRWKVIKRQLVVVGSYTICYVIGVCCGLPIVTTSAFSESGEYKGYLAFLILIYVSSQSFFDTFAWIFLDYDLSCMNLAQIGSLLDDSEFSEHGSYYSNHSDDGNDKSTPLLKSPSETRISTPRLPPRRTQQNLSNALRREVIALMSEGLYQAVNSVAMATFRRQTTEGKLHSDLMLAVGKRGGAVSVSPESKSLTTGGVAARSEALSAVSSTSSAVDTLTPLRTVAKKTKSQKVLSAEEPRPREIHFPESISDKSKDSIVHSTISIKKSNSPHKLTIPPSLEEALGGDYVEIAADGVAVDDEFQLGGQRAADDLECAFTDYAPHVFRHLRTEVYGISDEKYLESIRPGRNQTQTEDISANFSEGRSGAFFFFTLDKKYIIKTLTKSEASLLLEILEKYVEHFKSSENCKPYLNKFLGLHCLQMYTTEIYFAVLDNVFIPGKEPQEKYDLKGSWVARHTNHHVELGKLMKDEDLYKTLCMDADDAHEIYGQLERDSAFLESQGIMDYSLLLGIYYVKIDPNTLNPGVSHSTTPQLALGHSQYSHDFVGRRFTPSGVAPKSSLDAYSFATVDVMEASDGILGEELKNEEEEMFKALTRTTAASKDISSIVKDNVGAEYVYVPSDVPEMESYSTASMISTPHLLHRPPVSKRPRAQSYGALVQRFGVDDNAHRAAAIEGPGGYYIGMIDVLQKWDWDKKMERFFKVFVRCMDPNGISCVEPTQYRKRFLQKMKQMGIKPKPGRKKKRRKKYDPTMTF